MATEKPQEGLVLNVNGTDPGGTKAQIFGLYANRFRQKRDAAGHLPQILAEEEVRITDRVRRYVMRNHPAHNIAFKTQAQAAYDVHAVFVLKRNKVVWNPFALLLGATYADPFG